MIEEEKKIEERVQPYRFWLFAALSAFFVLTFVYYLPLRFRHAAVTEEGMHGGEMMMPAGGHGETGGGLYHEEGEVREGLVVNLNVTPVPVLTGTSTRLDFFVNEKPGNVPVPASALEIEHTKPMHVIGVRDDMNEFFHIHPQPTPSPGILSVDHTFGKPGAYKVWSEIKRNSVNHSFGHPEFSVLGEGPRSEKQVSFGRNAIVGAYQISLELAEPVAKRHAHELAFDIHTVTGDEVAVEDFLGAAMHLTIIRDDWKQFIHTHPEGHEGGGHHGSAPALIHVARAHGNEDIPGAVHDVTGEDEVVRFQVVFPESGLYKAFAQFRPAGIGLPLDEALTVSFWIRVEERAPAAIPNKVILVAMSLVLIALLSWATHRFLTVKS